MCIIFYRFRRICSLILLVSFNISVSAVLYAQSSTNHFCIEEAMRVAQERYFVSGLPSTNYFTWPNRFYTNGVFIVQGENPGPYPTNGFYCSDLGKNVPAGRGIILPAEVVLVRDLISKVDALASIYV